MKARFPTFDFSNVRAHWTRSPEFAQRCNAASLVPAYVEPFLLKVMKTARDKIDPANTRLIEEIDIFCKQEMQHCKQHLAFNAAIRRQGYEGLKPLEDKMQADYKAFLEQRSLRFNLAYCEGFESMSASGCEAWFEDYGELLEGAECDRNGRDERCRRCGRRPRRNPGHRGQQRGRCRRRGNWRRRRWRRVSLGR